jgi:Pyridoxamine 5'-phosphate oxidase
MAADMELVKKMAGNAKHLLVIATTRPDGTIHASLVSGGVIDDPVTAQPSIGMVIGGGTAKLRYLRATRRAAAVFQAGYGWVSVEGPVRLAGPDDLDGGVAATDVPGILRRVFVAAGGTHDDWEEYDRVMAAERRAAVFIAPERIMTNG